MKPMKRGLQLPSLRGALLAVALVVVLFAPTLHAQVLYGSIIGTVRDATGAVLPGATVTLTHNEAKTTRETVTDAVGSYRFSTVLRAAARRTQRAEGSCE